MKDLSITEEDKEGLKSVIKMLEGLLGLFGGEANTDENELMEFPTRESAVHYLAGADHGKIIQELSMDDKDDFNIKKFVTINLNLIKAYKKAIENVGSEQEFEFPKHIDSGQIN